MIEREARETDFIDTLVELATSISLERLPSSVVQEGRRTLVDTVGVILAGAAEPAARALAKQMAKESVGPTSTIMGSGYGAETMWAALTNATAGVWHEFDPGNRFVGGHPAIYVVSAGLAVAEREGSPGRRLLEAIIAGYEVGARVGLGTTLRPGMDPHGSWPIVGAATTAGLLMGYVPVNLRETINVSTSLNLGTSCKAAYEGATIRNAYAGLGTAMGVLAADLVGNGFTGERDGISTVFGSIAGEFFDIEKALGDIGRRWEITRGYHKLHACARCIHPALDALTTITKEHDVAPEQVERIDVSTFAMAATMNDVSPRNPLAARFSIPHALASCVVLRETGVAAYGESALQDPRVRDLAAKVTVRDDPELDARTPAERPAVVRVYLRDGRTLEGAVQLPLGEPDMQPLSNDVLGEKFLKLASSSLGSDIAQSLLDMLWQIETIPDVRKLTALCKGSE